MSVNDAQNGAYVSNFEPYGVQGCQVQLENGTVCQEKDTLRIIYEFQKHYEDKMSRIDEKCGGDAKLKIQLFQDWVRDLTEQNTMMVHVIEELEREASERVTLLEERLQNTTRAGMDLMNKLREENAPAVNNLQSDISNLLEFIRRIRENGVWSVDDLTFYTVKYEDLFGHGPVPGKKIDELEFKDESDSLLTKLKSELTDLQKNQEIFDYELQKRDMAIKEQQNRINELSCKLVIHNEDGVDPNQYLEEIQELRVMLNKKNEDLMQLEKSAAEMRDALTAEVADKHDRIVTLRQECRNLEERCCQADKQTHFKDDIIKEMRKEVKQLKSKIAEIEKENNELKDALRQTKVSLDEMQEKADVYLHEREVYEKTQRSSSLQIEELQFEINKLQENNRRSLEELSILTEERDALKRFSEESSLRRSSIDEGEQVHLEDPHVFELKQKLDSSTKEKRELEETVENLKKSVDKLTHLKYGDEKNKQKIQKLNEEICNKNQIIANKEEMIQIQAETLNIAQQELINLRDTMSELQKERTINIQEVENLQNTLKRQKQINRDLEKVAECAEERAVNLQQALIDFNVFTTPKVDLYVNTINVLEATKQKLEIEKDQQRITINNLQEAVVATKHQLEDLHSKSTSDLCSQNSIISALLQDLVEVESQYSSCYGELTKLSQTEDHLRDENFDLYVTVCGLRQDVEMLELTVAKYQKFTCKEAEINKLYNERQHYDEIIRFFKQETGQLAQKLMDLHELLMAANDCSHEEEIIALTAALMSTRQHNDALQKQIALLQGQIKEEKKLTHVNAMKTEELQGILAQKSIELQRCGDAFQDMKSRLTEAVQKNKQMETNIIDLNRKLAEFKAQEDLSNEKAVAYQKDVNACKANLLNLKQKVKELQEVLRGKSGELARLRNDFGAQVCAINCLKKENAALAACCQTESAKNKQVICDLEDKITSYEIVHQSLNEELTRFQAQLAEASQRENRYKQVYGEREKELLDKLERYETTCVKYQDRMSTMEKEIAVLKQQMEESTTKHEMIHQRLNEERAKVQLKLVEAVQRENLCRKLCGEHEQDLIDKLQQYENVQTEYQGRLSTVEQENIVLKQQLEENAALLSQLESAKGELLFLKQEINRLISLQCTIKSENETLKEHVSHLRNVTASFENRNETISEQLDKCLEDLHNLQSSKERLEQSNYELLEESELLRKSLKDLDQEMRNRLESVESLEVQLVETRYSRDEICTESRHVISNVRNWLYEQKQMNDALRRSIQDKNVIIDRLLQEKNALINNLKYVKQNQIVPAQNIHRSSKKQVTYKTPFPTRQELQNWGSYDADSDFSGSSRSTDAPQYYECSCTDDEMIRLRGGAVTPPELLHRVQSITDDLQRRNRYWKRSIRRSSQPSSLRETGYQSS